MVAILRAVDWLGNQGVDVVNMSLAGPKNKRLNRGQGVVAVRQALSGSAKDLGQPGKDPVFGAGLVQAADACRAN